MKNLCFTTACFLLFLSPASAQIIYTAADFNDPGDSHFVTYAKLDSLSQYNFQTAGANIYWNYSNLKINYQKRDGYTYPDSTGYLNSFMNECMNTGKTTATCSALFNTLTNIAHSQDVGDTTSIADYLFIHSLDLENKTTGSLVNTIKGLTLVGNGSDIPFTSTYALPDTIFHFPLEYGNQDSCHAYYSFNLASLGIDFQYTQHITRVNYVDGYGSLTTPGVTYPAVLRLRVLLTYEDTIINNGLLTVNHSKGYEYKWFDTSYKRPVFFVSGGIINGQEVPRSVEYLNPNSCLSPVAIFESIPLRIPVNPKTNVAEALVFNNSQNTTDFLWNFGDPSSGTNDTSTLVNPSHNYSSTGNYTITLIACNTICKPTQCDTTTENITVYDSLIVRAAYTYHPVEPCANSEIDFTNLSDNAKKYVWLFGDGTTAVTKNAKHVYTSAGTYTVTLYALGASTTDSIKKVITVEAPPVATITPNGPLTFCHGDSVKLTASIADSYQWSTGANFRSITARKNSVFSVTVTNACGTSDTSISVNVNAIVTPSISVTPSANGICPGTPVTFTTSAKHAGSNAAYAWSLNGHILGNSTTSYTDDSVKNGDVISCLLTSSISCVSSDTVSSSVVMVVGDSLVPSVSILSNPPQPNCAGTAIIFSPVTVGGGNGAVYSWSINGIPSGDQDSLTTSSLQNGDTLQLSMTSNAQCVTAGTVYDTLVATGLPISSVTLPFTICAGENYFGYTSSGIYLDTFSAVNGCDSIRTLKLIVLPLIQTTVDTTICNGQIYAGYTDGGFYIDTFPSVEGCDSVRSLNLVVNPINIASVKIAPAIINICSGNPVNFTAEVANGGPSPTYYWTLNGNRVGFDSATFSGYSNFVNGDRVALMLISNQACVMPDTAYDTVVVSVSNTLTPMVTIVQNPNSSYCQGKAATYYANIVGGGPQPAITWKVNGVLQLNTTDSISSSTFNNGDTLAVSIISNAGCASPVLAYDTALIIISPVEHDTVTTSICAGNSYGPYTSNGMYTDTFTSVFGCDSIRTLNLTVLPAINTFIEDTICEGDTLDGYELAGTYLDIFTSANGCDSVRTLTLYVNPVSISNFNVSICQGQVYHGFDTSGIYIDTIYDGSGNGCDSVVFIELTVNPLPGIPAITIVDSVQVVASDSSTDIATYQWYDVAGPIPGADSSVFNLPSPGNYYLIVTDSSGCTNLNKVNTQAGLDNISLLGGINIYPNPTDGKFILSLPFSAGTRYEVQVWNMVGQQVMPVTTTSDPSLQIDLSPFSQGLYLIQVEQGNQLWTGRISKEW